MAIILQLELEAAQFLQTHPLPQSKFEKLDDVLFKNRATIHPQHPDIDDDELARFFVLSLPAGDHQALLDELRSIEYVTAVYDKREAELP